MASDLQIAANRRNARKSTGPRSPEGKARVACNALRHGLRARTTIILPEENPEEFYELHAAIQAHYQPQNPPEQHLVGDMANAEWKLARSERLEADLWAEDMPASVRSLHLARLGQSQARLKQDWQKAYRELERIRRERTGQDAPPPSGQPAKNAKKFVPPEKLEVSWYNPRTGEEQIIARTVNGKPVDEFPRDPDPPAKPAA
ncbi:MAG TPA: hypothetical protein VMT86_17240 [Bryobacteraceae bacterium]|nr:hypothetical protein [Bryobacteraceae bacterium]